MVSDFACCPAVAESIQLDITCTAPDFKIFLPDYSYTLIDVTLFFVYKYSVQITYDEPKRLANIDKHGMNFADVTLEFFDTAMVLPAKEGRFMAINVLLGDIITVVFARLGTEGVSIISMRPASRKERSL